MQQILDDILPAGKPDIPRRRRATPYGSSIVAIHEARVVAPEKALPRPVPVTADPPEVIGIDDDDFAAVGRARAVAVGIVRQLFPRRDPIRGTAEQLRIAPGPLILAHPDRMLFWL